MAEPKHILLIDNEPGICRLAEAVLGDGGYRVTAYTRSTEAMAAFAPGRFDLVVTDIKMPGMNGIEVLTRVKELEPDLPVIMITAFATVEFSIQALRKGAYDMLTKPFEPEELLYRVRNALRQTDLLAENQVLREELADRGTPGALVGESPEWLRVLDTAYKVAQRDVPVLITGESGTGKELVARAVHDRSQRRGREFVAINCGALPESLLASELFGSRKGSYTGADQDRKGLLEAADQGTLFLDEVGNLPMPVQQTLLRFLQEREFYRVGETTPTRVDVRVLSATNSDLRAAVDAGSFREDLYYRLNVVHLHLPPLRQRRTDIPLLATHFVAEQNQRHNTQVRGFTPEATQALCEFPWPGNVRQLRNAIVAGMAVLTGDMLDLETLCRFMEQEGRQPDTEEPGTTALLDYGESVDQFERRYMIRLLRACGGDVEAAARTSGMNLATVYRKIKKYNLRRGDFL